MADLKKSHLNVHLIELVFRAVLEVDVDEDRVVGLVGAEELLRQDRAVDAVRRGKHVRGVQGLWPV